jgi:hypothetical protein
LFDVCHSGTEEEPENLSPHDCTIGKVWRDHGLNISRPRRRRQAGQGHVVSAERKLKTGEIVAIGGRL